MDSAQRTTFVNDCGQWGRAQHARHGWRIPYWELDDWQQWGSLWALIVLQRYDAPDRTPGHLFSLVRTSALRDLVDRNRSVPATDSFEPEADLRATEDTSALVILPPPAAALVKAVVSATPDQWRRAEDTWHVLYPRIPFYPEKSSMLPGSEGLALVIGWEAARVRRAQFALRCHINH